MNTQSELIIPEQSAAWESHGGAAASTLPAKKDFVEPEISVPVDVLEATTFFNTATSNISPG